MSMDLNQKERGVIAQIEALLFIYGDLLEPKKIAKFLNLDLEVVKSSLSELKSVLSERQGGLELLEHDGGFQLVTRPEFGPLLSLVLKTEMRESLTPATLETLSIIAYAGPIGRAEIDYIRGVNSTFSLRSLLLRGLIERGGDPERVNAYRYSPSAEFLSSLGVSKIVDLPEYDKFRGLVAQLNQKNVATEEEKSAEKENDTQ